MRVQPILRRGILTLLLLAGLLAAATARLAAPGLLDRLSLIAFDTDQRAAPRAAGDAPVAIVDIDDRSLARFGQWPWPRMLLARLVDRLAAAPCGGRRVRHRFCRTRPHLAQNAAAALIAERDGGGARPNLPRDFARPGPKAGAGDGDPVNLAPRLEGLGKLYGIDLVIGEEAAGLLDGTQLIEVDLVAAKGKPGLAVSIYLPPEPIADAEFGGRHQALMRAYRAQNWGEAPGLLDDRRLTVAPYLGPVYALARRRIAHFCGAPPPADWNGRFRRRGKVTGTWVFASSCVSP